MQATPPNGIILTTLNVEEAEKALIQRALELTRGNRTKTADLLGISVRTLRNKLNGPQRAGVAED
ncbi:MAG: helix-turn-helix domain-containing protein [Gemmatimonadetes bacterium]|nr:helix-turn-helix domain-containing protein [Gemmatimonadota bacterium]